VSGAPLVTGGAGFAGRHLVDHLRSRGEEPAAPPASEIDLLDPDAVRGTVRDLRPRAVFHMAALASVTHSWEDPRRTLVENLEMTLNVLEAVRHEAPEARVLVVGSGEVYGEPGSLPVREDAPLRPQNPYAVSKAACELLAGHYSDSGQVRCVRTRSFNHAGPGQSDDYVVGTFTKQVAEAELAGREVALLRTGDLEAARDFTDVRDVVRAYAMLIDAEPGVYNVCSGHSVRVGDVIDLLRAAARVQVRQETDPARLRAHDVPEIRGSNERLREATGWEPEIPLERTVSDALEWWRQQLGG
jgi:GDP-4-dehydro-6-deoxy-D-mannose reductase